jgi:hypothetical protein
MMLMSFLEKHFHKQRTNSTKKGNICVKTVPVVVNLSETSTILSKVTC